MAAREFESLKDLGGFVGQELVSDWLTVTQERIRQFAEATEDRQWIHLDAVKAERESPYGTTIAHGFLTLSLLSYFMAQSVRIRSGLRMGINYGLNRVRFPSALPVGAEARARFTLRSFTETSGVFEAAWSVVVERRGGVKPCCVAEWLVRYYA